MKWGRDTLIHSDPIVTHLKNVAYVPFNADGHWGLYCDDGSLIEESLDYRGVERSLVNQNKNSCDEPKDILENGSGDIFLYGGRIHLHYGHFLINTLPRLWATKEYSIDSLKIVMHSQFSVDDLFARESLVSVLGALGLTPRNFVVPLVPVRIREIIVPSTSFCEQNFAHSCFRDFCRSLGDMISKKGDYRNGFRKPIYLTKEYLQSGVGAVVNESIITSILRDRGVEIVAPELLSLREQIAMYNNFVPIIGTAGSAMHTSIFSSFGAEIVCINPTLEINTNFLLIDKLTCNRSIYLYENEIKVVHGENFLTSRELSQPVEMANMILDTLRQI